MIFSVQVVQFLKTLSFPFHYTVFSCRHRRLQQTFFLIALFSLTILVNNLPSPRLATSQMARKSPTTTWIGRCDWLIQSRHRRCSRKLKKKVWLKFEVCEATKINPSLKPQKIWKVKASWQVNHSLMDGIHNKRICCQPENTTQGIWWAVVN